MKRPILFLKLYSQAAADEPISGIMLVLGFEDMWAVTKLLKFWEASMRMIHGIRTVYIPYASHGHCMYLEYMQVLSRLPR